MNAGNNIGLIGLVLVLLNIISFGFTGYGIIAINEDIPPVMGYLGSGILQGIIAFTSIRLLPGQIPILALPFIYTMYLVATFFSVSFSGSAVLQGTMGKSLSTQTHHENIEKVTKQANTLLNSAQDMEQKFLALGLFSKDKAKEEKEIGGTCRSKNNKGILIATAKGPGPRQKKRIYQAFVFNQMAKDISDATSKLQTIKVELLGLQSVIGNEFKRKIDNESDKEYKLRIRKSVNSALTNVKNKYDEIEIQYGSINRLVNQHKQVLQIHYESEFSGFPDGVDDYQEFNGKSSACNDTETKGKIGALLNYSLSTLKKLHLTKIDPTDRKQFFYINAGLLWDLVSGKESFNHMLEDEDKKDYVVPLLTGMLIDFFILFLAITIQIAKGSTYRSYLNKHYSVDSLASIVSKMLPIIDANKNKFNFLNNFNNTRFEKTSVGYASYVLKHMLKNVTVTIDRENYLFQPREHHDDRQVRSDRAKDYIDLLKDVITVLHKYRFISSKKTQAVNQFEGNELTNMTNQIGLSVDDFGTNGAFNVYHIHSDFYSMLDEFHNNKTFAEIGEMEDWRRYILFIPSSHAYGEIMSTLALNDDIEKARYVFRKARKIKVKDVDKWQVVLNINDDMEKDVYEWLRDDDSGFSLDDAEEITSLSIFGFNPFHYKRVYNLSEYGWQTIRNFVDTVNTADS